MGLNYRIVRVENKSSNETAIQDKFRVLTKDYQLSKSKTKFEDLISVKKTLAHLVGVASFNQFIIISDELEKITDDIIKSAGDYKSILLVGMQSTVEVQEVEYWEGEKLVRKYSLGQTEFLDDLKELEGTIPQDVFDQITKGDDEIGSEQGFEANGQSTYAVLAEYGVKEEDILDLEWKIFEKV